MNNALRKKAITKVTGLQVGFTDTFVVMDNGTWRSLTAAENTAVDTEYHGLVFEETVQHFTNITTAYIEAKVQAYNAANGLAFKDIDAFTKYAINPLSVHHTIANKFVDYADRVWTAVRTYQATATTIPTDEEFKAILDGVVF